MVKEYSVFGQEMYETMAKLMTFVEGKKYEYEVCLESREHDLYDDLYVQVIKVANAKNFNQGIIIQKLNSSDVDYPWGVDQYFYETSYTYKIKQGMVEFPSIQFNSGLQRNINYGKYEYVADFVDYVINYKMANKIKYVSKEELEALLIEFIKVKTVAIEENDVELKRVRKDN